MTTEQLEQIFNDNTTEGYWRVGTKVMTLPKFIEVVSKILDEKTELRNDKDGNIEVPDLTELTEIEKEEVINGFGQTAVEGFMRIFYAFKLNTHIDYSCVEDNTGDKFTLQFRKVNYTESEQLAIEWYQKNKVEAVKFLMKENNWGLKQTKDFLDENTK